MVLVCNKCYNKRSNIMIKVRILYLAKKQVNMEHFI